MIVSLCPLGRRFELGGRRDWEEHADEQRGGCKQSIAKCGHESPRRYARRSDARGTVPLGRRKSCDGHHLLLVCCRCVMAAKADIPNLRFVPKPARRWRGATRCATITSDHHLCRNSDSWANRPGLSRIVRQLHVRLSIRCTRVLSIIALNIIAVSD